MMPAAPAGVRNASFTSGGKLNRIIEISLRCSDVMPPVSASELSGRLRAAAIVLLRACSKAWSRSNWLGGSIFIFGKLPRKGGSMAEMRLAGGGWVERKLNQDS